MSHEELSQEHVTERTHPLIIALAYKCMNSHLNGSALTNLFAQSEGEGGNGREREGKGGMEREWRDQEETRKQEE